MKPYKEKKIREVADAALREIAGREAEYLIPMGSGSYRQNLREVCYFYSDRRRITAVTKSDKKTFYGKLDELQKRTAGLFPAYSPEISGQYESGHGDERQFRAGWDRDTSGEPGTQTGVPDRICKENVKIGDNTEMEAIGTARPAGSVSADVGDCCRIHAHDGAFARDQKSAWVKILIALSLIPVSSIVIFNGDIVNTSYAGIWYLIVVMAGYRED